jgi:hypothetical protein
VGLAKKLSDGAVDELTENWEHRIKNYETLVKELDLSVKASQLQRRLHQRGNLSMHGSPETLVLGRFIWSIAHIFWHLEWLKII